MCTVIFERKDEAPLYETRIYSFTELSVSNVETNFFDKTLDTGILCPGEPKCLFKVKESPRIC